jgi:hypothetical protein
VIPLDPLNAYAGPLIMIDPVEFGLRSEMRDAMVLDSRPSV